MRKGVRSWCISLGIFFLTGTLALGAEKTDLKFAFDWVFYGAYAAYYVGLDKGMYGERGLKVTVERGYGAADGVKRLVAGANDLVMGDSGAAILARAEGGKVKLVAVMYERAPFTIYTLKKSGITEPKQLEGKSISTNAGDANYVLFPALARATGIDAKKINWVTVDPAQKLPVLLAGKVDAATWFVTADPIMDRLTAEIGGYNKISYADHGVDIYSNALTTTDKFVQENPGSVRGFAQATVKAHEYAFAQPEEAVRAFIKHQPHLDFARELAVFKVVMGIIMTPAAKANGIGWVAEEKMKRTRDITLSAYGKTAEVPLQDIYTNQFLR